MAKPDKRRAIWAFIAAGAAGLGGIGLVTLMGGPQAEANTPPENYVPTAEDIAQADQFARDFYKEVNQNNIEYTNKLKQSSIDGEGRILPTERDVFEIRSAPAKPVEYVVANDQKTFNSITTQAGIWDHQEVWNLKLDETTQGDFDKEHKDVLMEGVDFFDRTILSNVSSTYNIASGRVCDLNDIVNSKYDQDCYPVAEVSPGTRLASDIEEINKAYPDRAPRPAL